MDPCEIVNEEDFDYSTMSESSFVTTGSSSSGNQNQDIKNKGAAEPTRKVKKLRSIKLVRLPSLRLTTRQARVQLDSLSTFPSGIASLLQLDQADISDASPNYMKTTTSSDARKESLQKSSRILTRRSSFKPSKSLTRLSSTKYRRSLMRKSSGGSDLKGKPKKSRSIKTRNRSSIASSNDADTSANQLKERSHCDVKDTHFQASSCSPESSLSSNDKSEKSSKNLKPNLASGNKSMRAITRTSSLRPQRILTKMNSIRTKRPSMKKYSQMVDSSIQKATCSSVLKDSKFPDHLELQPGGSEYERISAMKVCTYSYCSLHGHRHSDLPPLKRFVSMRRRQLKTQRSIKLESRSFNRAKRSTKAKKGMQASKMGCQTDAAIPETTQKSREITSIRKMAEPEADFNGERNYGRDDEDTNNYECVGESILEEVLHPRLFLNKKLQLSELSTEESKEYCTDKKGEGTVASNSHNYFLPVDHPEHANTILQKVKNPGPCDILPFDDIAGTCHEEIPAGGEFLHNGNEARFSSLNFDAYKGDRELKTSEAMTSTSLARKPIDKFRSLSAKAFEDASRINDAISSASTCDQLVERTSERGEKNEDPLQDTQFQGTDSEPDRFSGLNFDAYKGDPELKTSETMTSTSSAREPSDKSGSLSAKAFEDESAINDVISYASTCDQLVEQTSDREEKNEDPQQDNQFPGTDSDPDRFSGLNFDAYKGDPELKTSEAMTSTGSAQEPTDESKSLSVKAFEYASTINDEISSASTCDQLVEQTSEREEKNEDPLQDNQFPETDLEPNRSSGLNFDACKGDPELKTSEAMTSTSSAREPIDKSRSLSAKAFEDARTINDVISYASTCDQLVEQTSDREEKNEDPQQDNQFPGTDSEPDRFSGLNFDAYKGDPELKTSEAMTSTGSAQEPTDESKSLSVKAFEDASTINDEISSASTCDQLVEQTSEREEKNEDPLQDNQFPETDLEPNRSSGLNFDACKGDPELKTSEAMTSTSSAREPIDKSRSLSAKAFEDARTINDVISYASTCDQLVEQTSDIEEKNEDPLQDNQFPGIDSEPHRFSGLNFDAYKGETELKTSEAMTSTGSAREPTDKSRSLRAKAFEDASTIKDVISSASTCDQLVEQTSEREEKNEAPLQDNQFPGTDLEPNRFSGLNFDAYKADPELKTSEAMTSTSSAREPIYKSRSLRAKAIEDASTINGAISSVSTCDQLVEQTSDREEKNEDLLQDNQFPGTDSEPDCNSPVVEKTQMEKQKQAGLWTLIYQHMASGIASDYEMQPTVNKMDKEQGEDANTLPAMNNSDSCGDFSGKDQGMEVYDHDRGSHKIELYQRSAIKLVQEAFDKILSEIPDHSSDDQSTKIDSMLDKGEKIHAASGFDSGKESTEQDQAEMRLNQYTMHGPEGQKTQSDVESKSNQQAPKSWSNLKKIIILKRFVKALEKVRNFNPRKLQHLPVQLEPEAEKIYLRHQAMEDRKNSEAWMLDYALQQVISTLAPAQKRKVALLVQAFETIVPLPETGTSLTYHVAASSHATPAQTFTASSYENCSGKGKENNFGISLRKSSFPKEDQDQVSNSYTSEEDFPESSSEVNKPCSEYGSTHTAPSILTSEFTSTGLKEKIGDLNHDNGDQNSIAKDDDPGPTNYCLLEPGEADLSDKPSPESADVATSSHDEVSLNGEILQEVPVEVSLISALEVQDRDFEFNSETLVSDCRIDLTGEHSDGTKSQIQKNLAGSIADDNAHISVSVSELQEESSKATEGENVHQNKCFQEFSAHEESKFSSADRAHEKQKNMRLWYLIYKHMVSGSASLLEEGPDKEEQADDANTSYGMDDGCSHQGFSQDKDTNNHKAGNQKIELQQIEAIRMVEEAIDEIPVPDIQDDSHDDQSVSSDVIRDQDFLERPPDEGGESYISNYIGCAKESFGESSSTKIQQSSMLDPKEPYLISEKNATADKEKTAFMEENKPKPPAQKNWSNLKRLILLKRFVKALEKVKKLNLREPQFLPLEPEKEPEKVHLRHQDADDRKNADEWMLDYALQKVVTKLTPARKRKVQLLVEAFESVMPTIGS